jgi:DNA-binding response OmpR family regulator
VIDHPTLPARILIVEDEPEFGALVRLWIEQHGWTAIEAMDGAEGLAAFDAERPDLVLLDVSLPKVDGWELVERMRSASQVPILMVTARGSEADKIRGLGAGADDYITKPFSFPELIARIEAALRRARPPSRPEADGEDVIHRDGLRVDPRRHVVVVGGSDVHLTPTEFRLLLHLAERPDELVSHRELLETVWGPTYGDDVHLLRVTMRNLRAKLTAAAPDRRYISTIYGLGYRFAAR